MSYVNIPLVWPFKMVPQTGVPGIHFDDNWAHKQIKNWERKVRYKQKWIKSVTTPLQVEASIYPGDLKVYDQNLTLITSFVWTAAVTHPNYKIYQTTFDVSAVPNGVYFLFMDCGGDGFERGFISEPIHIASSWKNVLKFTYKNSFNKNGMAWTTGIEMKFICEAAIADFLPERERTSYINQPLDVKTLDATPTRGFKLLIAEAPGVPPYMVDILNRIFCCDYVSIEGKQYETATGSKWEVQRVKGYPYIGASIDIVYAQNAQALQQSTGGEGSGFVTTYDIETDFFGGQVQTEVIEVIQNS